MSAEEILDKAILYAERLVPPTNRRGYESGRYDGIIEGYKAALASTEARFTEDDLRGLVTFLYDSKIIHDYKDGKVDFRFIALKAEEYVNTLTAKTT